MALLSYMLGGAHPSTPTPTHKHLRKRLRKAPPRITSTQSLYSCKGILDVARAQFCLDFFIPEGYSSVARLEDNGTEKTASSMHIGFLLEKPQADSSEDSTSKYTVEEMDREHPRRLRAKTPVFAVGQLERTSMIQPFDKAQTLAEQYQALLPPRGFTPFLLNDSQLTPKNLHRLRKTKCQLSLRDLVKEQELSNRAHSVAYSDAETLVGSESPTSQHSRTDREFDKVKLPIINPHDQTLSDPLAAFDDDIGLKICVDLLTNELATALFRQHPAERQDRASGLQILLMIEAYEAIQKNVRQQLCDLHVTQEMKDHVKSVDKILRYWLKVLYSVYDHSQDKKLQQKVDEDQWPLCASPEEGHETMQKVEET
jgi:hypothetical protein